MIKIIIFVLFTLTFSLLVTNPTNVNASNSNSNFSLPKNARKITDTIYDLGSAIDPKTKKTVEGRAIIHYKKDTANLKPSGGNAKPATCYGYLSKDVRWKTAEPWVFNPTNNRNLDQQKLFDLLSNGIKKWEDATDGNVSNGLGTNILGDGVLTSDLLIVDSASPDGKNEVLFGDITDSNAIAVTTVWGIWSGPAAWKEIVEWDQIYDDTSFDWSAETSGVTSKMDFENISTHELGHSIGLADLYNSCTSETMYGYASEGETNKRDLNSGDITGINALY